ncbi:MAG: hypothetical protein DHS20C01_14900 [marine bacterium B5-7]|nr:MAG: hypothetical protein DHS20C01_14900 [marine bacterium B5-7]
MSVLTTYVAVVAVKYFINGLNAPENRSAPIRADVETDDRLRLFLLGDTGTGEKMQLKVASAMEARCRTHGVDAIVMLGDNFYPKGVVSVVDSQWQEKIFDIYNGPCLGAVPIYAVLGNHDYLSSPSAQINAGSRYPRWNMPARYYTRTFGNVLSLVAIDTEYVDLCSNTGSCMTRFLRSELISNKHLWRVVIGHKPLKSANFKKSFSVSSWLLSKFICGSADFYISGHSHHLEHRIGGGCKTGIFVSGGGGNGSYEINTKDKNVKFVKSENGFLELEATSLTIAFRFFRFDGKKLYVTKSTKPPESAIVDTRSDLPILIQ